jgi:trans-aconitate methyltransferase
MKRLIKNNFAKASKTYAESDFVQKKTAAVLTAQLSKTMPDFKPQKIFDIGSGTGNLSKHLTEQYPGAVLYLNDISEAMLKESGNKLKNKAEFYLISGDIENLQLEETYDLIASNMCLQWLENLKSTIQNMYNHSHLVAISLPLHGTFKNWYQLLKKMA